MNKTVVMTRTFESTDAKALDKKVNKWLGELQYWDMYKFKLISISKFYEDGRHIVNVIFEINYLYSSTAMK